VCVLADVEGRIERKKPVEAPQQNTQGNRGQDYFSHGVHQDSTIPAKARKFSFGEPASTGV
jgi:hypothetical protein